MLASLEERRSGVGGDGSGLDRLAGMGLKEYLDARDAEDLHPGNLLLVFDQFEELLTLDPTDQDDKRRFLAQLGEALRSRKRWALFSMREDYLAALDPFLDLIPTTLQTRFRLDFLGPGGARDAIARPALEKAGVRFDDHVLSKLVDDLRAVWVQGPTGRAPSKAPPVSALAFASRGGDRLAAVGWEGRPYVYTLRPEELLRLACTRSGRLTRAPQCAGHVRAGP